MSEHIRPEDVTAYMRYMAIEPLLAVPKGELSKKVSEVSKWKFNDTVHKKIVSYSERHLYRMLRAYREKGFDGLKNQEKKTKGSHRSVPDEVVGDLLKLKQDAPTRSAYKVIRMLEIAGKTDEGFLHPRTVNRIFKQMGYTRADLSKDTRTYIKHEKEHVNELWMSDVMEGFYLNLGGGEKRLCYMIGFIDDCSRVIPHAQFYFDSTLPKLEDALRKAITKHGIPTRLYVDNGKIYIAKQFKIICAKLGIKLIYATAYHPAGKGKQEKFWDYVQKSFISEINRRKVHSLTELNDLFFAWLKTEYHDKPHSALKTVDGDANSMLTPMERRALSLRNGRKLVYKSPVELDEIFLHEEQRRVSRYGVVSFGGNTYEVPGKLVGKTVTVKYNPFDLSVLKIYFAGKYVNTARIINLKTTKHRDVEKVVEEKQADSEISKLYFENMKINYAKYLEDQLHNFDGKAHMAKDPSDTGPAGPDETHRPAPKDKKETMSRNEFVTLIARSMGEEQLTYLEKQRLYELWDSLKDFDPDIFTAFLEEIKEKVSDYRSNFIYYVEQIKNLYLKRRDSK